MVRTLKQVTWFATFCDSDILEQVMSTHACTFAWEMGWHVFLSGQDLALGGGGCVAGENHSESAWYSTNVIAVTD